ncbi:MAG TPA: VOC family protein [Actinophytocola sp.]|uniref:VOC family protein n=1 Tax=Actinophytocola sp. TaxID=1872138 RepID=UPI002DB8CC1A|nr:VOC family protein [Actinophytocola sp.]HEU5470667.1 VOC family protein [Actinophytocola sp.]
MSISKLLGVVPVGDHAAGTAWYQRLLGRAPDARPMPGLADWHLTDTAWVSVFHDPARAGHTALNFAVADLAAHTSELATRGITLGPVTATDKNAHLASVTDPDGNVITFIENPSV